MIYLSRFHTVWNRNSVILVFRKGDGCALLNQMYTWLLSLHGVFVLISYGCRRIVHMQCYIISDFHAGLYSGTLLKHECLVYAASLTDSQCPSCSHVTDGTHTSFIMTAGGLGHAPTGPACPASQSALCRTQSAYKTF